MLLDFFTNVYKPTRLLGRSQRTIDLYLASVEGFSRYLRRPATVADLTDSTVGQYLQNLLDRGRSAATVNKERSQLLAIWRMAARKKLVEEWPEIRPVPEPEVLPVAWTLEELWRLRISCNMQPGNYAGVPANRWWLALHCVLWSTGERISAVMHLKWSDISGDCVTYRAETRKGGTQPNQCRIPDYAVDSLQMIREPIREPVFPWTMGETYLYRVYHTILERAELDTSARSKFHRIRRSHATHLKLAGGDPTSSLKHSDPAITLRYIDPRQMPKPADILPHFGIG